MREKLVPVVPFTRPDSQNRIIVPNFLIDRVDNLIVTKLRGDVANRALYFLGIVDPNSKYGEDISADLGSLLETRPIGDKNRLFIPAILMQDRELSFLRHENESSLAVSLLPDESGVFAGYEEDVIAFQRLLR